MGKCIEGVLDAQVKTDVLDRCMKKNFDFEHCASPVDLSECSWMLHYKTPPQ